MENIINGAKFLMDNGPAMLASFIAFFGAAYSLALWIPGEQPDKFLKGILDFTKKFSKKKK